MRAKTAPVRRANVPTRGPIGTRRYKNVTLCRMTAKARQGTQTHATGKTTERLLSAAVQWADQTRLQTLNEEPQPQVLETLGLPNLNPAPMAPST